MPSSDKPWNAQSEWLMQEQAVSVHAPSVAQTLSKSSDCQTEPGFFLPSMSSSSEDSVKAPRRPLLAGLLASSPHLERIDDREGSDRNVVRIAEAVAGQRTIAAASMCQQPMSPASAEQVMGGPVAMNTLVDWMCAFLKIPPSEAAARVAEVPRNDAGELTSMGSVNHATGDCKPCAYWFKGVCAHSVLCRHCHCHHAGQRSKRLRPSKQRRQKMRQRMRDDGSRTDESDEGEAPREQATSPSTEGGKRELIKL
mmetsp:Transcript_20198/g.36609  ORF Transcript_20198/g.36609 Transcript_20198/m.36609 type:complete len:254 (+) Transcript_20198:68-829(+)